MLDRSNYRLNAIIERYIDTWDGTFIGMEVKNMYENGTSYDIFLPTFLLVFFVK